MALSGSFHNYPTSQFGLYCEWSGFQSISGNYTDVTLNIYLRYYTISVSSRSDSIASINGTSETYTTPAINDMSSTSWHNKLLKTKTVRVNHNSNGTKTGVELKASWRFSSTYSGVSIGTITASTKVDLNTIDRAAPTVSCSTSVVSATSFTISATASTTCDLWEYSLDGGSTWTQYSTSSGTSTSKTLTGLTSKTYSVKVRARKKTNQVKGTSSATSVDIVAPTVSFTNSNITANSIYINASSSVTCNLWQYSIDGGSSWVQFSTSEGTSATKTITGLSPNVTYSVKVRARKKSNSLYGTSSASSIKTLGGTLLNSVSTVTADASSVSLSLNWTVYDTSYTHSLAIKNGSTTILTITGLTGSTGTNNKTYTLTSSQRTTLLNYMSAIKSFTATLVLTTYSGSSQVGDTSSKTATIQTTASNSAPSFTNFTFKDNNSTTVGVTGNNQLFVQNKSSLLITCTAATAKNGASINKYTATIGSVSKESVSTSITYGGVSVTGTVTVTVTATDSRGYTKSVSKNITVIEYENISIDSWRMRRLNEVDAITQLYFEGSMSSVSVNDVAKNSLQKVEYRFKRTNQTSWSVWYSISGVISDPYGYEYENLEFTSFDLLYSYDIQIKATDRLTNYTITLRLNKGTPLVAFRPQKVGINNVDPQAALDVSGDIMMNGFNVLGYVKDLSSDDNLNDITASGIYFTVANLNNKNYPTTSVGLMEVFRNSNCIIQRYTTYFGTVYIRGYYPGQNWSVWQTL